MIHYSFILELWDQKKIVLFPEIDRAKFFLSLTRPHSWTCIRIYIFNFIKAKTRRQKSKETKDKKRVSVENLMGYNDIVYEIVLCTFKLLDRVINFSWLGCSYEFNVLYLQRQKYSWLHICAQMLLSFIFFTILKILI